jgi:predicted DsbA family dithiol-disulfide isomerase
MTTDKMKVEIWSDVMCPFCYIGKRKFEAALAQFKDNASIDIIWKSFQLAPELKTAPNKNSHQFLAEHKGMSLEQATRMNNQVADLAQQVGLVYDFDRAIPANSFNAHRFAHLAQHHELQAKAEEALFSAYFTEGRNIDDIATLVQLGEEIGLEPTDTRIVLDSNKYAAEVQQDIYEAQQIGVRGVPFFVFDRKYAVSGAQESGVFLETLGKAFTEFKEPLSAIEE